MLRPGQHSLKRFFSTQTTKPSSPSSSSSSSSSSWRFRAKERQLVSQISTILSQRHNWPSLIRELNLPCTLTPLLFRQILSKTQNHPHTSIEFLNWAKSNLGFTPDLLTHLDLIRILVRSGNTQLAKPILDSVVAAHPPSPVVDSLVRACEGAELGLVPLLSFVIERYAKTISYLDSLEAYRRVLVSGFAPEIGCCNVLLDALGGAGEFRLFWCFYGSVIRSRVSLNSNTWSVIAKTLKMNGKQDKVSQLLDSGVSAYALCNVVIEWHCKDGNFEAALDRLNEMFDRKLEPGFSTYSSILDSACEFGDEKIIQIVMEMMTKKKLISGDHENVIKRFCDLGKTYAAEMLLKRLLCENLELKEVTFGRMVMALARGGRTEEAMDMHLLALKKGVVLSRKALQALADSLCLENPSPEVNRSLIGLIAQGVKPGETEISRFMTLLCRQKRWEEAGELLGVILEKEVLFDFSRCRLLILNYCSCGEVESALSLHDKLEKMELVLDATAYNELLRTLFGGNRVEEATRVFEYMRKKNVVSRASFIVMISGLSGEKEMRNAMRVHDEMLKLGMKPCPRMYKSLISVFR